VLWLAYLVFRPTKFFQYYVVRSVPALTALCAWAYGISAVVDRIETRVMTNRLTGRPSPFDALLADWRLYWGVCVVGGVVSGFLYYHLGGWWFRKRLGFSGAKDAERGLARRVYLFAAQAYTVPFIVYSGWQTLHYATPRTAHDGNDWGGLVVLGFLFWSIYVQYLGVRTVFPVRPGAARVWFLILPSALYSLLLAGVMALVLGGVAGRLDVPDLTRPVTIEREAFSLRHPANWQLDLDDPDYDPDHDFELQPQFADAAVHFWIFHAPIDPEAEVATTADNLARVYELVDRRKLHAWGRFRGAGWRLEARAEGGRIVMSSFCAALPGGGFEILEVTDERFSSTLEPGFQLIRESFEWKREAPSAAPEP